MWNSDPDYSDYLKQTPLEVKIGDNVFLLKGGKIKKLDSHYTGPYEILEVLGKGNVKISYKRQTYCSLH